MLEPGPHAGGEGWWEKWFRDTTLIVRKSRKYKSSQNSLLQIEASSKTSKAFFPSFLLLLRLPMAHAFNQSYANQLWSENQSRPVSGARQVPLVTPRGRALSSLSFMATVNTESFGVTLLVSKGSSLS